jgi:hypothetical protein
VCGLVCVCVCAYVCVSSAAECENVRESPRIVFLSIIVFVDIYVYTSCMCTALHLCYERVCNALCLGALCYPFGDRSKEGGRIQLI